MNGRRRRATGLSHDSSFVSRRWDSGLFPAQARPDVCCSGGARAVVQLAAGACASSMLQLGLQRGRTAHGRQRGCIDPLAVPCPTLLHIVRTYILSNLSPCRPCLKLAAAPATGQPTEE
ncbi:hypothetical protein VFPFJ_01187 [Purpureocillium lilacinum]|uniref:Uncharacterized protein n=1 Tax=Purpureocillium lilacinum TaxID=33203 RepID=A0A179HAF4_PURLI|nr:hypothetical protein VFPFJ_01187 [Purpureocillium lilacinum]OAQ87124.1 hypothetical protein VFPBJ_01164 [Purpureocillium lilacinum]OAQ95078.1 hypothetical protein VFPFJ_01187 [Purpureocillium lilacinum]